jgi:protein SCO1/2
MKRVVRRHTFVTIAMALGVLLATALGAACGGRPAELPVRGHVPDFALTDQDGAPFGSAQLKGQVWVANFIFTRCPDICPAFTAKMAEVQDKTATGRAAEVRLVSFSVDPAHDTPERLRAYAEAHGARPERWRFVTGDPAAVRAAVEQGMKVHMEDLGMKDGVPNIGHGSHFVLVDRRGDIRGYYDMNDADAVARVVRDARQLVR